MNAKSTVRSLAGFTLPLLFAYAYAWIISLVPSFGLARWQFIALINTALAALVLNTYKPILVIPATQKEALLAWSAGFLTILGTFLLIYVAGFFHKETHVHTYTTFDIFALCVWIPIIEELIFRRWLSQWVGFRVPGLWAIYVSGLAFALAHTHPTLSPWPPLGPFLLGCACTWVYRSTARLMAPILLHAACNTSAILLAIYAPSLLEQLNWLYQKL